MGLTKEEREARKAARLAAAAETQNTDPSFEEVPKDPAIEHAKKLARQDKEAKKIIKPSREFYTIKDGKVLNVKVNFRGAYSTFIGVKNKMEKKAKGSYFDQVKRWQKAGQWVSEEDYQEHCEKIKDELARE